MVTEPLATETPPGVQPPGAQPAQGEIASEVVSFRVTPTQAKELDRVAQLIGPKGWRWTKAETRAAVIGFALDRLRDSIMKICKGRHGDGQG